MDTLSRRLGRSALVLIAAFCVVVAAACGSNEREPVTPSAPVPLAERWPSVLHLGMANGLAGAPDIVAIAPFGFRYQYLAGGVGDGAAGWATWENTAADGSFIGKYVAESKANGLIPVFSYYMLLQSTPDEGSEAERLEGAVRDADIMRLYLEDLRLFFERAGEDDGMVVLHVEPDLWGYLQRSASRDSAATVPVQVAGTGLTEFLDLPDTAAGLAQAIVRLRDRIAPNVVLAYHFSSWATGVDPFIENTDEAGSRAIGERSAAFYQSLGANFDLVFTEFTDRDAGFKEVEYGDGGASWWDASDFARHRAMIAAFHEVSGLPLVLWQIPYGNTKMRALDNTWNHYQDNRVEWLLDDAGDGRLQEYIEAGVVAFLFGRGADGATDASDAAGDGVTNPEPINGNDRESISAADDGGYFAEVAAAYYAAGPLPLK